MSRPPTGDKSGNGTATFPTGSEAGWLFLSSHGKPSTCPGPPQTVHFSHPPPPRAQAAGYHGLGFFLLSLPWYTRGRGQISCQNAKTRPKFRKCAQGPCRPGPVAHLQPPTPSGLRNLPESSAAGPQVLVHEVLSARTPAPLFFSRISFQPLLGGSLPALQPGPPSGAEHRALPRPRLSVSGLRGWAWPVG